MNKRYRTFLLLASIAHHYAGDILELGPRTGLHQSIYILTLELAKSAALQVNRFDSAYIYGNLKIIFIFNMYILLGVHILPQICTASA